MITGQGQRQASGWWWRQWRPTGYGASSVTSSSMQRFTVGRVASAPVGCGWWSTAPEVDDHPQDLQHHLWVSSPWRSFNDTRLFEYYVFWLFAHGTTSADDTTKAWKFLLTMHGQIWCQGLPSSLHTLPVIFTHVWNCLIGINKRVFF